ncbi:hypothetical protein D9611_007555 [Ephemerocybe angulata]|uniref:Uncharacterized protein n=1 Tax=Ephemerocybe angulata TaxID=980116 RepID=A0A8H5BYR2_9AGAR|nr:hypothetical protein D9611_007555 [Tulosesus angulatus]
MMPPRSKSLPSFSFVLNSPAEALGEEHHRTIMSLIDNSPAATRQVRVDFSQPSRPPLQTSRTRVGDDHPFMRTVDTRFAGHLSYDVVYSKNKKEQDIAENEDENESNDTATGFEPYPGLELERMTTRDSYFPPSRPRSGALRRYLIVKILRALWHKIRRVGNIVFCRKVEEHQ